MLLVRERALERLAETDHGTIHRRSDTDFAIRAVCARAHLARATMSDVASESLPHTPRCVFDSSVARRQLDDEFAATPEPRAVSSHGTSVQRDERSHDRQAEAEAAGRMM